MIVEVGRRRFAATAEVVGGEPGRALWAQYELLHPTYPKYRESRAEEFPMVILRPE